MLPAIHRGGLQGRFVEGEERSQQTLLPACLDDYIAEDNPVCVVDAVIDELDHSALGFERVQPAATGRPAHHSATPLKIYLYGYLNRIQSSRRLEREAGRNVELMWLTGRLAPDFKTRRFPATERICDPRGLRALHRDLWPPWPLGGLSRYVSCSGAVPPAASQTFFHGYFGEDNLPMPAVLAGRP